MITIDRSGPWRIYAPVLPQGAVALGTVRRSAGDTGALVRLASGVYVQANAGAIRTLDQRAVRAALGPQEAPCPP